ncbi:hypothetical protein [Photobacterium kasasachensis]|uniref:hypothetical protein n=1 Tax=Photobacterium kasasachensis TaxID=2910240 RepID=UPI003D113372
MSIQDTLHSERIRNQLKNNMIGVFLNFILPGLGHCYAGKVMFGLIFMLISVVCIFTAFLIVPGIIYLGIWIWTMVAVNRLIKNNNEQILSKELAALNQEEGTKPLANAAENATVNEAN